MNISLTQKERTLLEDQKSHEEICVQKYNNYANQAQDPQLSQLFNTYAQQEQEHLNTINQMLGGEVPDMEQSQGGTQQEGTQVEQKGMKNAMQNEEEAALCTDMLMTEKYVSNTYDTAIFEFTDANARQALNHIQKEEQQHGEGIFNYMQSNGLYNPQ